MVRHRGPLRCPSAETALLRHGTPPRTRQIFGVKVFVHRVGYSFNRAVDGGTLLLLIRGLLGRGDLAGLGIAGLGSWSGVKFWGVIVQVVCLAPTSKRGLEFGEYSQFGG